MNLAAWLQRSGRAFPDNPAVALGEGVVVDYRTLARRAAAIAAGLAALGLHPGERVAICSKNRPEYVEAMFGIWWGGFAAVPGLEERFQRDFERSLRVAQALRARHIHVMAGVAGAPEALDPFRRNLAGAAERAPHASLTIEP